MKISKQFPKETKIGDVRILDSLRSTITGDIVVNLAAVHRDDIRDKAEYQKTNIEAKAHISVQGKGYKQNYFHKYSGCI